MDLYGFVWKQGAPNSSDKSFYSLSTFPKDLNIPHYQTNSTMEDTTKHMKWSLFYLSGSCYPTTSPRFSEFPWHSHDIPMTFPWRHRQHRGTWSFCSKSRTPLHQLGSGTSLGGSTCPPWQPLNHGDFPGLNQQLLMGFWATKKHDHHGILKQQIPWFPWKIPWSTKMGIVPWGF